MKALVVGGAGYTGHPIIHSLLDRGYEVTMLHRGLHEPVLPPEVEHIHADPHWRKNLEEALDGRSFDLVMAVYGRLRHIAEVVKDKTPRLISVGGALAVYKGWMTITQAHPWEGMEESPVPVAEDSELARAPGVDHFSERVRDSEDAVMEAHAQGYYNSTHFRYPIVYGPRGLAPPGWGIIRRALEGRRRLIVPGGGRTLLSRGFADNIAHGLLLAVDNPMPSAGQIYNICDDTVLTNRQWINLICTAMNHEFEFVEMPYDVLPPSFRDAPVETLYPCHRVMDISKIKRELGYRDVVPIEKAIEITAKWYSEHRLEPGGEEEQSLGDPFNYETEDRMIDIYVAARERAKQELAEVPASEVVWRHPYPHPQKPGDIR